METDHGTAVESTGLATDDEYEFGHYVEARPEVEQLRSDGRHDELEDLLRWCIELAEAEQLVVEDLANFGDLPAVFYTDLARLYRDANRYEDEVAVLERYVSTQERLGAPVESEVEAQYHRAQKRVAEWIRQ
ncbi:hypothetical protein [Halosimplex carlsbadense]|uniref:hypothetical protein n=1 Tax=Halosimplex carlsbadense TaxID=171164 RepID=UPI0012696FA4|nr:hypothetical protein [Halosimplex carlsbadense]